MVKITEDGKRRLVKCLWVKKNVSFLSLGTEKTRGYARLS